MENSAIKRNSIGSILVEAIRIILSEHLKEICAKISQLEKTNYDLYTQLGAAHGEILDLKNRVNTLENQMLILENSQ